MELKNYSLEELQEEIERREVGVPDEITFTAYLHGGYTRGEWEEYIEDTTGYLISDQLITNIINSLYEVGIPMKIDTKTGKVTGEVKIESG